MPTQSTLDTLICKACGRSFETEPRQAAHGRAFCSRACANDARRGADSPVWKGTPDQVCLHCGVSFHVKASQIAKGGGRYCSKGCAARGQARPVPLICKACGASFEATASQIARHRAYCSVACGNAANQGAGNPAWKGIPDQTCHHCGKVFHIKPSRVARGDGRYCSKECFNAGKRCKVERTCESCGTPFLTFPSTIARGQGRFCSSACWYKHFSTIRGADKWTWKGGQSVERVNEMHRIEYKQWRAAVFTRDNWTCVTCGKGRDLNAHHIKSYRHHPELRLDVANGVTLCKDCHKEVHRRI